ncbi:MAG: hypothetical protein IJ751_06015, partial [Oscillospiraceae bacterium]|nr:hypothetical protein [Oscillospiraceae bacterium]
EYVRVTIYRYWWDSDNDRKMNALSPSLIELTLNGGTWADGLTFGNGWILDPEASTPERVVLYLNRPLDSGDTSPIFTDTLTINPAAAASMTTTREGNVITTTYQYNGVEFGIEAEADAVQTHNAEAAILSAWGRSVSIADDGSLSLN